MRAGLRALGGKSSVTSGRVMGTVRYCGLWWGRGCSGGCCDANGCGGMGGITSSSSAGGGGMVKSVGIGGIGGITRLEEELWMSLCGCCGCCEGVLVLLRAVC